MNKEFERACGGEPEISKILEFTGQTNAHIRGNENKDKEKPIARNVTRVLDGTNSDPCEGMQFSTADDAYFFYNDYARRVGFGTCIKTSRRSRTDRSLILVVFGCSKHGFKKTSENTKNPRPNTKTDCKVQMKLKRVEIGNWVVIFVNNKHNHELVPESSRFMRSHKKMVIPAKQTVSIMDIARVGKRKKRLKNRRLRSDGRNRDNSEIEFLREGNSQSGGESLVGKEARKTFLGDEEVQALYAHFLRLKSSNPTFFYAIDFDQDSRPRCIFWIDGKSKTDYCRFGDVVAFDTRYVINKHKIPLATFVGVNHHGQSVLLGCALIREASTEVFTWLFRTWLRAMCGRSPMAILTDQDLALKTAVLKIFPEICHRFCIWHIVYTLTQKLGNLCQESPSFLIDFRESIFKCLDVNEFEGKWWKMLEIYGLMDDGWFSYLYENRQQWVPVYLNDSFFAGLSSPLGNESICSYFDPYVSKETSLKDFLSQYELVIQSRCEKEAEADNETTCGNPPLKTTSPFEAQLAYVYTREIFNKFQVEIMAIPACIIVSAVQEGDAVEYIVRDSEAKMDVKVMWIQLRSTVSCQCRIWEFHGFLCRHAMLVMLMSGVYMIPSHCILKRWTMEGRNRAQLDKLNVKVEGDRPKSRVQRFNALCQRFMKFAEESCFSEESYTISVNALRETVDKVVEKNLLQRHIKELLNESSDNSNQREAWNEPKD